MYMSGLFKYFSKGRKGNEAVHKTIGIIGLCRGAGSTQLGIMLAFYLANVLKQRVALVCVGEDRSYEPLKDELKVSGLLHYKGCSGKKCFSYKRVDFYCGVKEEIIGIIREYYDYVIIKVCVSDSTETLMYTLKNVLACDLKILVGSMLLWRSKDCLKRIERINRIYNVQRLTYASLTYNEEVAEQLNHMYGLNTVIMEQETNPLHMKGSTLMWLQNLL